MAEPEPPVEIVLRRNLVILDLVEPNVVPEYCTYGMTSCMRCQDWCWLGSETFKVVDSGQAFGICIECAVGVLPLDHPRSQRVHDHLRADGPQ